ncbi:MAG: hypothetical protein IJG97_03425 [Bacilli bacterium]|nr:hypothetical protein [Bacilli bacterium]
MDKKDNSIKTNNTVFINSIAIIQFIYLIFIGICMSSDSLSSSSIEQIIFLIASIILSIIGLVGIIKGIISLLDKKEDKKTSIKLIVCCIIVIIINVFCASITMKAVEKSVNDSWRCDPGPCENSTNN